MKNPNDLVTDNPLSPKDLYELAEEQWRKLLEAQKENTPLAARWEEEMDYWWDRMTVEERLESISNIKKQMEQILQEARKITNIP